jgi:hypothetical protein
LSIGFNIFAVKCGLSTAPAAFAVIFDCLARACAALLGFFSNSFDFFDFFDLLDSFTDADFAGFAFLREAPAFVTRPFAERAALAGVVPLFALPLGFVRVVVDRVRAAFRPPPTFLTLPNPAPSLMLRSLLNSGYVR